MGDYKWNYIQQKGFTDSVKPKRKAKKIIREITKYGNDVMINIGKEFSKVKEKFRRKH
jgi:hypothetical protein